MLGSGRSGKWVVWMGSGRGGRVGSGKGVSPSASPETVHNLSFLIRYAY